MNLSGPPLLELRSVCKTYDAPGGSLEILHGIDLSLARGESLAILGPSGCGKSTFLNIIGTLDRPTSGQVLLDGKDLALLDDRELARTRNRQIGFIFQLHHLLPQCTVLENVLIPTLATPNSRPGAEISDRALHLLERVGLADRRFHRPGQLSGGERQRTAVVRALINRPLLLLADEPTGSLDHASAESLSELLAGLNREENLTLIVVTHSRELASRMSRVCEIRDARLESLVLRRS
ncbi:MAG: ABC transporter ATP-binding protein [Verrucomicrobiota bacterium]